MSSVGGQRWRRGVIHRGWVEWMRLRLTGELSLLRRGVLRSWSNLVPKVLRHNRQLNAQ